MLRERRLEFGDLGVEGADERDRGAGDAPVGRGDERRRLELFGPQRRLDLFGPPFDVALAPPRRSAEAIFERDRPRPSSGVGATASTARASVLARSVPKASRAPG